MTLRHSRTRRPRHSSLPSLIGMRQSLVTSRWCPSQTVRWPSSVTVSTATDGCIKRSTPSHSTPRRNRGSLALKARLSFCSSTQLGGTSTKNCPHDLARLFVDYRRVFRVERSFSVDALASGLRMVSAAPRSRDLLYNRQICVFPCLFALCRFLWPPGI